MSPEARKAQAEAERGAPVGGRGWLKRRDAYFMAIGMRHAASICRARAEAEDREFDYAGMGSRRCADAIEREAAE